MTAKQEKNNKKMEATLGVKDDGDVILDRRGLYKLGDRWWVKIARINVRQMIAGWGVISQAFVNVQGLNLDWNNAGTWGMLFLTALPHFPGKFYQFIMMVCELQNTTDKKDADFYAEERDAYADYIRRNLKTEELLDIIQVVYDQEKDRFGDLVKKVRPLLEPMIKMWQAEQEQNQKNQMEKALKDLTTGKDPST